MEIVFVAAKRTPFGAFGGSFLRLSATDLAVESANAALSHSRISPELIDHVTYGNVMQTSADAAYLARHVALRAGLPESVACLTLNRLCGSGFEAIADGARRLRAREASMVMVGGTESMSQAPYTLRGARFGYRMNHQSLEDTLVSGLCDSFAQMSMAETAERLATQYGFNRLDCDRFASESQRRAFTAWNAGLFGDEVCSVLIEDRGNHREKHRTVERDEHVRPDCTPDGLAKLKPVFKADGVVTAGNASGMVDGACTLVMTSADLARTHQLEVLGTYVDSAVVGCDPKIMGIGPVPATRALLQKNQLDFKSIRRIEINEAFAPQYLAVEKELGLNREITNVEGGAIALGHPLGASGARIVTHLLYALRRESGGLGIGAACIGGGQGISVLIKV